MLWIHLVQNWIRFCHFSGTCEVSKLRSRLCFCWHTSWKHQRPHLSWTVFRVPGGRDIGALKKPQIGVFLIGVPNHPCWATHLSFNALNNDLSSIFQFLSFPHISTFTEELLYVYIVLSYISHYTFSRKPSNLAKGHQTLPTEGVQSGSRFGCRKDMVTWFFAN